MAVESLVGTASFTGSTGSRTASRGFALLGLVQFTLILALGVLTLALPELRRDFGLSQAEIVLLNTAYGLSFTGLLLLGGRLADLVGHRRMFRLGTAIFVVTSITGALAWDATMLLIARFGQGAGAALAAPAAMALITSVFSDPASRLRAIAAWGGLSSAGATVGTLLGGVLAATWWRSAFLVPAVIGTFAVVVAPRLLPSGPRPKRLRLDVAGAVLATTALCLASYGLVASLDAPWSSPRVLVPVAAGVVLAACFFAVERRTAEPLLPPSFLVSARRATGLLGVLLSAAGAATIGLFLSLYLQQVRGWSPVEASAAFVPYFLILATSVLAGRHIARAGIRTVTATGLIVSASGLLLLGQLEVDTAYVGVVLTGLVLFTIGAGLTFAGATVAAFADTPQHQVGLAGGVMNTAMEMGPSLGLALLASLAGAHSAHLARTGANDLVAATGGYAFAFTGAAMLFIVAGLVAARTLRSRGTP